jgi:hypothetical protein
MSPLKAASLGFADLFDYIAIERILLPIEISLFSEVNS